MKHKNNFTDFMKTLILGLFFVGLVMCIFWYPFSLSIGGFAQDYEPSSLQETIIVDSELVFFWLTSIPCFIVLVLWWKITNSIENEGYFNNKIIKLLNKSALILLIDILIFITGNIIYYNLKWNDFFTVYIWISIVGLILICFILFISFYIKKGIEMKEENNKS